MVDGNNKNSDKYDSLTKVLDHPYELYEIPKGYFQQPVRIKLNKFLRTNTKVGDLVIFRNSGWQIGCTIIDHEDLFLGSLNRKLLDQEVESYYYEEQPWTTKPVMVVNLL